MRILLFVLCLLPCVVKGQNYQCFQNGVNHYFINGNGYLRGIRIDSIRTSGDLTVYYPFHTPRGQYNMVSFPFSYPYLPVLDPTGGSWLGRRVVQKGDGTFIFDNYWNDSVILKTQANIGDTWVFYKDGSSLYYSATVSSVDTMTVLSYLDSVKTIIIHANNGSGIVTSDSLNGFKIMLSKNYGFVQVFDLYTFPYHKPDSLYRPGLDFFWDRSTLTYRDVSNSEGDIPGNNMLFKIIDFSVPNDQQLNNWMVGDVFEFDSVYSTYGYDQQVHLIATVVNKSVSGHAVTYDLKAQQNVIETSNYNGRSDTNYSYSIVKTFYDNSYSIVDPSYFPESGPLTTQYVFYFPSQDTCFHLPVYTTVPMLNYPFIQSHTTYTLGIGLTGSEYADGSEERTNNLIYVNYHGADCGTSYHILGAVTQVHLHPNPARNELVVTASDTINHITTIDVMGRIVYKKDFNDGLEKETLDISGLPRGIYFIKVNGVATGKFVKE